MLSKHKIWMVTSFVIVAFSFALWPSTSSAQAGANLSLPFARRSKITQAYGPTHQAIDYRAARGTPVVAARAGTVTVAVNRYDDGEYGDGGYGNWIEIDHGGGYRTRYAHLSHYGFAASVGQYVYRGQRIANADDTGNSTADHLHFELRYNGTPVDPYAGGWVSGSPIPMGFRDQNGSVHGPYALDNTKIHDKWLALNGEPGSPLEDDWSNICDAGGTGLLTPLLYIQEFERGYIQYCGTGSAEYVAYARTFLPDARIDYNGWNSSIVTRNNSGSAPVSLFFHGTDGKVTDSRVYDPYLPQNAVWTFQASGLASDWTNPITNFIGSAVIVADQDVVTAVENRNSSTDLSYGYDGVTASGGLGNPGFGMAGSKAYLPLIMDNYFGWYTAFTVINTGSAQATLTIRYYNPSGGTVYTENVNLPVMGTLSRDQTNMSQLSDNILYATMMEATNGQPIAAVVRQRNSASTSFLAYNGFSSGTSPGNLPVLMNNYYGWNTGFAVQNIGTISTNLTIWYYTNIGTIREDSNNLPARASRFFYQPNNPNLPSGNTNGLFAAIVTSSSQPVAIAVNQTLTGTVQALSYAGFVSGSQRSVQPVVMKNYGDGDGTWVTSVTVQNVGTSATNITVTYNDPDATETRWNVPVGRSEVFYQPNNTNLPANYRDWAEVTSSGQPAVAVVNATVPATNADLAWSYNGFNR